ADLADLMMLVALVADKARNDVIGLAAGMAGPAGQRLVEIDIEHDAAEIEQQRVGGAGGEAGRGHGACSFLGIQYRYGSISSSGNALKTLGALVAVAGCRQDLLSSAKEVTPNSPNERITLS